LARQLEGERVTPQQRKRLATTAADVAKLVPLMLLLLVPFLEFALPVLLRIFPGLLPSTFRRRRASSVPKEAEEAEAVLDAAERRARAAGTPLDREAEAMLFHHAAAATAASTASAATAATATTTAKEVCASSIGMDGGRLEQGSRGGPT
jgi:hypothetical protein